MFSITTDTPRRAVLCVFTLLGFFLTSAPTSSGAIAAPAPASAKETALVAELAEWLRPSQDLPLRDAVRERRESFDLFLSFHDEALLKKRIIDLPFGQEIRETANRYSVDALLLASIIEVESGFDPRAVSRRGATGLMQVMPSTADSGTDLCDPERNLEAGASYLNQLLHRFGGDLTLALAAYNAGPDRVRRYGGVPPFRETRRYVERVLKLYVDHHRHVWNREAARELALL